MNKVCSNSKCSIPKDALEFHKNHKSKDGLQYICKVCSKEYYDKWYSSGDNRKKKLINSHNLKEKNRKYWLARINEIFGKPRCFACGYDRHFEVLEFHHHDPSAKEANLADWIHLKPTKVRLEELKKGHFLCPTCHRELHLLEGEKNDVSLLQML